MKKIICLVGPSGAGKSSLLEALEDEVKQVWSYTTRPLRDGVDKRYHIPEAEFLAKLQAGDFAQSIKYNRQWYGLTYSSFAGIDLAGVDCTQQGVIQLKNSGVLPEDQVIACFVVVSPKTLLDRLVKRQEKVSEIRARLLQARREALLFDKDRHIYNLLLVNKDISETCRKIRLLIRDEPIQSDEFCAGEFVAEIDQILSTL